MDSLGEREKEELFAQFEQFDKNKDGRITLEELLAEFRAQGQNFSEEEGLDMIELVDEDGDGMIDFGEFVTLMKQHSNALEDEDEMKEVFEEFYPDGVDGDGFIYLDDLVEHLKFTDEQAEKILALADKDRDGRISYKEFVATMYTGTDGPAIDWVNETLGWNTVM